MRTRDRAARTDIDHREAVRSVRELADQAFSRAAGASLVTGNHVRVLRDAQENYPAEFVEASYPVRLLCYAMHRDSGGPGRFRYLLYKDVNRHPALVL